MTDGAGWCRRGRRPRRPARSWSRSSTTSGCSPPSTSASTVRIPVASLRELGFRLGESLRFASGPCGFRCADSDLEKADIFKHCNKRPRVNAAATVSARDFGFDLGGVFCSGVLMCWSWSVFVRRRRVSLTRRPPLPRRWMLTWIGCCRRRPRPRSSPLQRRITRCEN